MVAEHAPRQRALPRFDWASVVPIWVGALVGAVLIALYSEPGERIKWIALTMAACTVAALSVQLGMRRKDGLIDRLGASVTGAIIVLGGATAIFFLCSLGCAREPR